LPREFKCHLMVAQPLAALDRAEVPDQAVVAAASFELVGSP
jgi:hypothetical protein